MFHVGEQNSAEGELHVSLMPPTLHITRDGYTYIKNSKNRVLNGADLLNTILKIFIRHKR